MLLNGTPIHVVKEILGHSTIKTTELYAFTNEEAKREASKNALVERSWLIGPARSRLGDCGNACGTA